MKVRSSVKKPKDKHSQIVRRRRKLYIINKRKPRLKVRQG